MRSFRPRLSLLAILLFSVAGSAPASAAFSPDCDCEPIAGTWERTAENGDKFTLRIPLSCENVDMTTTSETPMGLTTDKVVCIDGIRKMQLRFPPGYVDDFGTPAQYPLPPNVAAELRGTIYENEDGSIQFGLDKFEAACLKRTGKRCDTAKFFRVPAL